MKSMRSMMGVLAGTFLVAQFAAQAAPIVWKTTRAEAMAAAQSSGKLVLLLAGRETCGNCQNMKYTVCELPAIRAILDPHYVPWFCDINSTEWYAYSGGLGTFVLPLICVIAPSAPLTYKDRTTGIQAEEVFRTRLLSHVGGGTGAGPVLSVMPTSCLVSAKSGRTKLRVRNTGAGGISYRARENSAWLRIAGGATGTCWGSQSGTGAVDKTVTLAFAGNPTYKSRTAIVTVAANGVAGNSPQRIKVVQRKRGPVLDVTPATRRIEAATTGTTFRVSNPNTGRFVYRASETSAWMRIAGGARGTNRGTVVVACLPNTTVMARTGTVRVVASGAAGSPKRVKVVQQGCPPCQP